MKNRIQTYFWNTGSYIGFSSCVFLSCVFQVILRIISIPFIILSVFFGFVVMSLGLTAWFLNRRF
ncbi:MAG: hypothetical protein O2970_06575 [Proteobacteria bacterium]|nr:hypothetical protein [Pseudomonadota bacterium]MDG4547448.1 hypothetical protein [Rickettsiales bacterium]